MAWNSSGSLLHLKLIGLAFAIVTFAVVTATAAVVVNVDVERLDVQSTLVTR